MVDCIHSHMLLCFFDQAKLQREQQVLGSVIAVIALQPP